MNDLQHFLDWLVSYVVKEFLRSEGDNGRLCDVDSHFGDKVKVTGAHRKHCDHCNLKRVKNEGFTGMRRAVFKETKVS